MCLCQKMSFLTIKGETSMKYEWETEEQFLQRVEEAKAKGICVFRNDDDREFILDIIDDYLTLIEAVKYQ